MIRLDAVSETATLYELKLGAVFTAFRTSSFGVETVQCKDLCFTVWVPGGQCTVQSVAPYLLGYEQSDLRCSQQ